MNDARDFPSRSYAWSVIVIALLGYILSNVDRLLISILIVPIQRDLGITDTQFGLLQGLALGLFYAGFCIPIGALSDRYSRPLVISLGMTVWSIASIASGLVGKFSHMFVARALVGAGEASLQPAVYSLVGDLFPRERLGRAMGVYSLGPFLGSTAAFLIGGLGLHWLGETAHYEVLGMPFHSWQLIFILAGAPGILLAILVYVWIAEPRSERPAGSGAINTASFGDVLGYLSRHRRVFVPQFVGFPLLGLALYTALAWAPAYLIRVAGLSSSDAGIWLGGLAFLAGGGGALTAGFLTDLFASRRHLSGPFLIGLGASALLVLAMAVTLLLPPSSLALATIGFTIFLGSFTLAPAVAVIQATVPRPYRSRISAMFLVANLVVQAAATIAIGLLNDKVFGGPMGIVYSLPTLIALSAAGGIFAFMKGRRPLADFMAASTAAEMNGPAV